MSWVVTRDVRLDCDRVRVESVHEHETEAECRVQELRSAGVKATRYEIWFDQLSRSPLPGDDVELIVGYAWCHVLAPQR